MEFATSIDQYAGAGRKLIKLGPCDGEDSTRTVLSYLMKAGLLQKKRCLAGDDTPGSIFYWFKHVASQVMSPDSVILKQDGNCGVCFHHITNQFRYINNNPEGMVNLTEDIDVRLPPVIISGSECITLTDEFSNLMHYIMANRLSEKMIRFAFGKVDAWEVVKSHESWEQESYALPISWFYFKPSMRRMLMLGQRTAGFGFHTAIDTRGLMPGTAIKMARLAPRGVEAYRIFNGHDEYGHRCGIDSEAQAVDRFCFVVLEKRNMARLVHETERLETRG